MSPAFRGPNHELHETHEPAGSLFVRFVEFVVPGVA
jgi:hypothetical protein